MRGVIKRFVLAGTVMLASAAFGPQGLKAETVPSNAPATQTLTPERQLIALRHIMEQATTPGQQQATLALIGETGTFQAMMFAGQYLQEADKLVARQAAEAVAAIALQHPEYNGANTRALVQEALPLLKGAAKKAAREWLSNIPQQEQGYVSLFNGQNLDGWKGLVENPIARAKMSKEQMAAAQQKADQTMREDWVVEDGLMAYVGHGFDNICTIAPYADFEMIVDWRLDPDGKEPDAGIYLRGTPQVQIWDIRRTDVGAQVGSGGLYNNTSHRSTPLSVEDNRLGEWNTFRIVMRGERVTVFLNGVKVVDNEVMENYWDRKQSIPSCDQIELQAHGSKVYFRDIYVKAL